MRVHGAAGFQVAQRAGSMISTAGTAGQGKCPCLCGPRHGRCSDQGTVQVAQTEPHDAHTSSWRSCQATYEHHGLLRLFRYEGPLGVQPLPGVHTGNRALIYIAQRVGFNCIAANTHGLQTGTTRLHNRLDQPATEHIRKQARAVAQVPACCTCCTPRCTGTAWAAVRDATALHTPSSRGAPAMRSPPNGWPRRC